MNGGVADVAMGGSASDGRIGRGPFYLARAAELMPGPRHTDMPIREMLYNHDRVVLRHSSWSFYATLV